MRKFVKKTKKTLDILYIIGYTLLLGKNTKRQEHGVF